MTLRIVADENMPNVDAWFSDIATSIIRKPGRTLTADDLADADVLLVRSVTQVNAELLEGTPIRFVGSATIGTDHIDQAYLSKHNIPFHYAPGCNAQSVADWLLAVLSRLHIDHDLQWWQKTIGIVGVGNVGSTVRKTLERFGCRLLLCDPLKANDGQLPEHVALDRLLEQADIVSFHTPHTQQGDYPTHRMMQAARLANMRAGSWLINAGRGPVFDDQGLIEQSQLHDIHLVLDVWPNEPTIDEPLLNHVALASPHVAGYSLEGKYQGTRMLAESVCGWASLPLPVEPTLPKGLTLDARLYEQADIKTWASELILAVYDPARDTATLRASIEQGVVTPTMFDALRKHYPTRRELQSVTVQHAPPTLADWLICAGLQCE